MTLNYFLWDSPNGLITTQDSLVSKTNDYRFRGLGSNSGQIWYYFSNPVKLVSKKKSDHQYE